MQKTRCPNCQAKISLKWLINSSFKEKYRCKSCGSVIAWKRIRELYSYITLIFAIVAADSFKTFILVGFHIPYWLKVLFSLIIGFSLIFGIFEALLLVLPQQFKIVEDRDDCN